MAISETTQMAMDKQLNWMCFGGRTRAANGLGIDQHEIRRVATPYRDVWAYHHTTFQGWNYYNGTMDLQVYDNANKKWLYYSILVLERSKEPASKRIETTEIQSASGTYAADYGLYNNGSVSYSLLLTPRYGEHYGKDLCFDMFMQFMSYLEAVEGYGVLQDSYENRWCYAYFAGVSNQQVYTDSISFTLKFSTKPEWYDNDYGKTYTDISDFSSYTGKDGTSLSTDKMYRFKSSCIQDCPPLLYIQCDTTASNWYLKFPNSPDVYSDKDITLQFNYAGNYFIDCINQGYVYGIDADTLYDKSQYKEELIYDKTPTEYVFKTLPHRYPAFRMGENYIYGEGIKALRIYPMDWQL